jgi:hypothetical protein
VQLQIVLKTRLAGSKTEIVNDVASKPPQFASDALAASCLNRRLSRKRDLLGAMLCIIRTLFNADRALDGSIIHSGGSSMEGQLTFAIWSTNEIFVVDDDENTRDRLAASLGRLARGNLR